MVFHGLWQEAWVAPVVNHLWQSTAIAVIAWLLARMLRNNQARTRYWVWMIASVKFLLPFSLLIVAGESLRSVIAPPVQSAAVAGVMEQLAQPFPHAAAFDAVDSFSAPPIAAAHHSHPLLLILAAIWFAGLFAVASSWARKWWRIRAAAHAALQTTLLVEVPVFSSRHLLEPGVFGIFRPVLLLPENLSERLCAPQFRAVIAHEMCHIRRRDNLTAAIHMVVLAIFWFYPPVWWIKAQLVEERERACDEAVLQSGNEAEVYAESILNVCKFYIESPLACISGITGSDLKRRIVRIMTERVARKLDFSRKLLLSLAATAAIAAPIILGLVHITQVRAQSTAASATQSIADTWQGTLHAGRDLRTVVKITKADDGGGYKAVFYSIDQGGTPLPVTSVTLQGSTVKMSLNFIGGSYVGKLSPDGKTIVGTWSQGPNPLPLTLTRATPETEWTIPAPPPKLPPMDANASPSFEVATIKPSKPDEPGKMFGVRGRQFKTINTTLDDLISFAYDVHAKQVIGAPAWAATDKFDIDAEPDGEGAPSAKQWKIMVQKLLADRFQFAFHHDKRELSVYALSVAKNGPKMAKAQGDPNGLPALFFHNLGDLHVANATMSDFAGLMQAAVLDRPVVDQTGLGGRFDFNLKWTPDDSQFGGLGAKVPPPTDSADAPPNLYTAIQEQIGLKLDATKTLAEVLVIDKVEKPSAN
ncbi:MAG TPA: M56 family metallopeptidase [Acidobacteriaceae bacterium]|jgi:uncharacterized protein (TIGR03435 family)